MSSSLEANQYVVAASGRPASAATRRWVTAAGAVGGDDAQGRRRAAGRAGPRRAGVGRPRGAQWPSTRLRPTTPTMIRPIDASLTVGRRLAQRRMTPKSATSAVPAPAQTAYAIETSRCRTTSGEQAERDDVAEDDDLRSRARWPRRRRRSARVAVTSEKIAMDEKEPSP